MKLLILTTCYPPDTAIAAVRPYMLAKYLTKLGHSVTVLRSGEINDRCEHFFEDLPDVRVISYLGEESSAERFARGEAALPQNSGSSRIDFLPELLRLPIARCYHFLLRKKTFQQFVSARMANLKKQKAAIDELKDESFDIVFSTVGEFENALAGQYAAEIFGCPLIQDFRDPMTSRALGNKKQLAFYQKLQDEAVGKADACTAVSRDLLQNICGEQAAETMVLYNGYEPTAEGQSFEASPDKVLTFCYTGSIYKYKQDFTPLLQALKKLADDGKVAKENLRLHYAGKDFAYLHHQAEKLDLGGILTDHGSVGRREAAAIQASADLFLVLSWNTKQEKGVLTGKFYEGIRARKPILAVVAGDVPNSELHLINEKYRYGFCYENCRKSQQFAKLCDYLEAAYKEKMTAGSVSYDPDPALKTDFRYDALAKKLEALCLRLLEEKK